MGTQVDRVSGLSQESGGNLDGIYGQHGDLLLMILVELRIMNDVLADGLNSGVDLDGRRQDLLNSII